MDRFNLNIDELLRFVFAGGWAIACFFFINPTLSKSFLEIGVLEFGALLFMSLIFGSLIYSVYRAIINPNLYKVVYWIAVKSTKRRMETIGQIPFITSRTEIKDAIFRWTQESYDKSIIKRLKEWASQVHFLYCSALSGIISIILSKPFGEIHSGRRYYIVWFIGILLFSALISHIRYCLHYLTIKEESNN